MHQQATIDCRLMAQIILKYSDHQQFADCTTALRQLTVSDLTRWDTSFDILMALDDAPLF